MKRGGNCDYTPYPQGTQHHLQNELLLLIFAKDEISYNNLYLAASQLLGGNGLLNNDESAVQCAGYSMLLANTVMCTSHILVQRWIK